jgi:hypothetical protein
MRYRKGSVALSEEFDLPLLLLVRNARCIGREQLHRLLNYDQTELGRRRLAWRADRLVQAQYLDTLDQRIGGDRVYAMNRKGLLYLEMAGHALVSIHSSMERLLDPLTVAHSLDLVDIHVKFTRDGVLDTWMSDVEISSENMETGSGYAKDYDAIATLRIAGKPFRFAIECERTTKSRERYREMRERLARERALDGVLYFVRDGGRLFSVAGELANAHPELLFCSIDSFRMRGIEAIFLRSVVEPGASLTELLGVQQAAVPASR